MKEYITTGFYFIFIPKGTGILYCSGVNIDRFLPVTKGRHKAMSNPVIRGLQLVNLELRSKAIAQGATPVTGVFPECSGLAPTGDIWYTESIFFKNLSDSSVQGLLEYAVQELLLKIDRAILLRAKIPREALPPQQMEEFIDELCRKHGCS